MQIYDVTNPQGFFCQSKADLKCKQHLVLLKTIYSLPSFLLFLLLPYQWQLATLAKPTKKGNVTGLRARNIESAIRQRSSKGLIEKSKRYLLSFLRKYDRKIQQMHRFNFKAKITFLIIMISKTIHRTFTWSLSCIFKRFLELNSKSIPFYIFH